MIIWCLRLLPELNPVFCAPARAVKKHSNSLIYRKVCPRQTAMHRVTNQKRRDMDWKDYLANTTKLTKDFRKAQPDVGKAFTDMHRAVLHDGALSVKHKELQAIVVGIVTHCADCIGFHLQGAVRAGATRAELEETIATCILMGGGPAYMYGMKALEAYDQLVGNGEG